MASLPSHALRRTSISPISSACASNQVRHASLLKRPYRPYTFTQLITMSDGSTYTHRTTSPAPIFKSTKDTRNHALWQPSMASLRDLEEDEAGRLRAFRERFGRGWDVDGADEGTEGAEEQEDTMMDLISGFKGAQVSQDQMKGQVAKGNKY